VQNMKILIIHLSTAYCYFVYCRNIIFSAQLHFSPSQYIYILQSVREHSAVVLTVTINGMQEIRPVIHLLFYVQSQLIDVWLLIDEVSISHTTTHHSR
jgi:hypothetical protein